MHNTHRILQYIALIGILLPVFLLPTLASAQTPPPPSTLIPCGFDLNGDGQIYDVTPPASQSDPHEQCYFNDVIAIAQNVINFLIFKIAAPLAAVMFAYAGFLYVTNRGNESQVKQAHDIFMNVFIGLVVALVAWLVVNFILEFFLGTGSQFNFLA